MDRAHLASLTIVTTLLLSLSSAPLRAQTAPDIARAMERFLVRLTPLDGTAVNRPSSGVVVRPWDTGSALAATALDAVAEATRLTVADTAGRTFSGQVIHRDRPAGVALISIPGWTGPRMVDLDDRVLRPGEQVVVLGFSRASGEPQHVLTRATGPGSLADSVVAGFEGGPIASLAEQRILGLMRSTGPGGGTVVPAAYILASLAALGAPPVVAQPAPAAPTPTPAPLPVPPRTPIATPSPPAHGAVPPALEASLGTANWSRDEPPGTAFFFLMRLPEQPPAAGIIVTVSGPSAWNDGKVLQFIQRPIRAGEYWYWAWMGGGGDDRGFRGSTTRCLCRATSGEYVIRAAIGGTPHSTTARVNAADVLTRPTDIRVTETTRSLVTASWSPVPGAVSYYSVLWRRGAHESIQVLSRGTKDNSITLSGLDLDPTSEYSVQVSAFNVDISSGSPPKTPLQFNVSALASVWFRPR